MKTRRGLHQRRMVGRRGRVAQPRRDHDVTKQTAAVKGTEDVAVELRDTALAAERFGHESQASGTRRLRNEGKLLHSYLILHAVQIATRSAQRVRTLAEFTLDTFDFGAKRFAFGQLSGYEPSR